MPMPAAAATSAGFATEWLEPAVAGEERIALVSISPALLDTVMRHWPVAEGEAEDYGCRDMVRDRYGWNLGLVASGIAFMPELPHVAQACAETAVVPWAELAPFLTVQAQQAGAQIAGR